MLRLGAGVRPEVLQVFGNDAADLADLQRDGPDLLQVVFHHELFDRVDHIIDGSELVHYLPLRMMRTACLPAYLSMGPTLSSQRTMLEASGTSRSRWIASNMQRVVHRPQPMQRFGSTTLTPQPRQREASALTCSSVKVSRSCSKDLALAGSCSTF